MAESNWRRGLRYRFEYALVRTLYGLFAVLPLDTASAVGGWIGRRVGPRLALTARARRNLRLAFPDIDDRTMTATVCGMWDNLGRVFAEYPHLAEFRMYEDGGRVEVIGAEHVDRLRDDGIGGIFIAAHLGNWEIASLAASQRGLPLVHVYRGANNPHVERLLQRARQPVGGSHHPKGRDAARALLGAIKDGAHLGMLVDQKYNEGIAVPFFGHHAMTAPALAEFAFRFEVPVVPARIERLAGARFRLTIAPPLAFAATGDRAADVAAAMTQVNDLFETWIRARPEQWLWLHRRWGKHAG